MNSKANCYNQKFGHNFAGGICLDCHITQGELNVAFYPKRVYRPKAAPKPKRPVEYTMHHQEHAVAAELSELCGEKHMFGMYLGVVRRIGLSKAYQLMSRIKDPRSGIKTPGRWFMYQARNQKSEKK